MQGDFCMDVEKIFTGIFPPYVHLATCDIRQFSNWSLSWIGSKRGDLSARTIRGTKCSTVEELFTEFGAALQFPYYFGENWDAFHECITDLEWISGDGYLLFIVNAERVLAKKEDDFRTFVELLHNTGREWGESQSRHSDFPRPSKPFHVVFQTEPITKRLMLNRLERLGLEFSEVIIPV